MTILSDTISGIIEDLMKDGYAFRSGAVELATAAAREQHHPMDRFAAIISVLEDMELNPDSRTH